MIDLSERIAKIEREIRETPYHKGTEHYIGQLKARLAKLRQRALASQKRKGGGFGFALKKEGDATLVLVGPPSVGKSTLLNKLTGAHSRVESWPFSTVKVIPGMMTYKGAKIQIFDLPGIIGGAAKGVGRGKEVLAVARNADLLLLMVDVKTRSRISSLLKEIHRAGIDFSPLVVINKVDLLKRKLHLGPDTVGISAEKGEGLEDLQELIWEKLELMRIYLKPKDNEVDRENPLIIKKGTTVADVAAKIFPQKEEFKQIFLWGSSALFPGQKVGLGHRLQDKDTLTFV